jgi:hypothetical protein
VRITSSPTSAAGTNLVGVSTSALAAGASQSESANLTVPTTPGTYYVWVIADDFSNVTNQSNTSNDLQHSVAFTVVGSPPPPPPSSPNMIDALSAPTLADNAGAIPQQYQTVGFYLGRPTASPFSATDVAELSQSGRSVVSIYEHNQSFNVPSYFTIPQADTDAAAAISAALAIGQPLGSAIYFAVDDADSALSSNNISAIDSYFAEISADFGNLGWLVTNVGPLAAANPYQIGIYAGGAVLSSVSNISYYWFDPNYLGGSFSGAQITRNVNGAFSIAGVSVDTDTTSVSNFGQWSGSSSPPPPPPPPAAQSDLLPENITLGATSVAPGGSLSVNWSLVNQGTGAANAASATEVRITSSPTSAAGTNLVGVSTAALAAGASQSESANLTVPTTPGTYYVWVIADDFSNVTNQSNTSNDLQHSVAFTVVGSPPPPPPPPPPPTVIESFGVTSLTQVGGNYFLYTKGTTNGPELMYQGTPVTAGEFGAWAPIGAEPIAGGGYEVAWTNGANQFTVWDTDSNGNKVGNAIGVVSGSDASLELLEPSFQQDLNGDGVTGLNLPTTIIESFGSTSLEQVGSDYFLYAKGTMNGPELMFNGAPVTAGEFGVWAPIGAEPIAGGGYEVAWTNGANQFTVWDTDSNGNKAGNAIGVVSGTDSSLETLEPSFQQDLNGDGVTGVNPIIESFGSTSLEKVGNDYFLYAKGTTNGPELMYQGAPVTAGEFGVWAPIAAEPIAGGGYEVAWTNGANQFTVWDTDSNGNKVGNAIGVVSGSDASLELLEPSFQQDLNGDGVTGLNLPTTIIESFGSTSLAQVGSDYFLYAKGTTNGPELMYQGAPVTAGEFGVWAPIGTESIAGGGYEVAWTNGANQFTVWDTDANGNKVGNAIGVVSGNDPSLEALEPSFQQDLNGDGVIGTPSNTFGGDITTAEGMITAQVQSGATTPFHLTSDPSLVDQIVNDLAAFYSTPQSDYTIGTANNTNSSNYPSVNRGLTEGFVNVSSELLNSSDNQFLDQCVALLQAVDPNIGLTGSWIAGTQVDVNGTIQNIAPGTPIATFTGSTYNGAHAAFFLGAGVENNEAGFFVLDQYNTGSPTLYPDGTPLNTLSYEPAEIRFISTQDSAVTQYCAVIH